MATQMLVKHVQRAEAGASLTDPLQELGTPLDARLIHVWYMNITCDDTALILLRTAQEMLPNGRQPNPWAISPQ